MDVMRFASAIIIGLFLLSTFTVFRSTGVEDPSVLYYQQDLDPSKFRTTIYNVSIEKNGSPYDEFGFKVLDDTIFPNYGLRNGDQLIIEITDPQKFSSVVYPYTLNSGVVRFGTPTVGPNEIMTIMKNNGTQLTTSSTSGLKHIMPKLGNHPNTVKMSTTDIFGIGTTIPELGTNHLYSVVDEGGEWVASSGGNSTYEIYWLWDSKGLLNNLTYIDLTDPTSLIHFEFLRIDVSDNPSINNLQLLYDRVVISNLPNVTFEVLEAINLPIEIGGSFGGLQEGMLLTSYGFFDGTRKRGIPAQMAQSSGPQLINLLIPSSNSENATLADMFQMSVNGGVIQGITDFNLNTLFFPTLIQTIKGPPLRGTLFQSTKSSLSAINLPSGETCSFNTDNGLGGFEIRCDDGFVNVNATFDGETGVMISYDFLNRTSSSTLRLKSSLFNYIPSYDLTTAWHRSNGNNNGGGAVYLECSCTHLLLFTTDKGNTCEYIPTPECEKITMTLNIDLNDQSPRLRFSQGAFSVVNDKIYDEIQFFVGDTKVTNDKYLDYLLMFQFPNTFADFNTSVFNGYYPELFGDDSLLIIEGGNLEFYDLATLALSEPNLVLRRVKDTVSSIETFDYLKSSGELLNYSRYDKTTGETTVIHQEYSRLKEIALRYDSNYAGQSFEYDSVEFQKTAKMDVVRAEIARQMLEGSSSPIHVEFFDGIEGLTLKLDENGTSTDQDLSKFVQVKIGDTVLSQDLATPLIPNLILPSFISAFSPCTDENPCYNYTINNWPRSNIIGDIIFGGSNTGDNVSIDILSDGRLYVHSFNETDGIGFGTYYSPQGKFLSAGFLTSSTADYHVTVLKAHATHTQVKINPIRYTTDYSWIVRKGFDELSDHFTYLPIKDGSKLDIFLPQTFTEGPDSYKFTVSSDLSERTEKLSDFGGSPFVVEVDGLKVDIPITVLLQLLLPTQLIPLVEDNDGSKYPIHGSGIGVNASCCGGFYQLLFGNNITIESSDDVDVVTITNGRNIIHGEFTYARIRQRPDLLTAEWDELIDEQIEMINDNPLFTGQSTLSNNALFGLDEVLLSIGAGVITLNGQNFGSNAKVALQVIDGSFYDIEYSLELVALIFSSSIDDLSIDDLNLEIDYSSLVSIHINGEEVNPNQYLGLILKVYAPIFIEETKEIIFANDQYMLDLQNQLQKQQPPKSMEYNINSDGNFDLQVGGATTNQITFEYDQTGRMVSILISGDSAETRLTINGDTQNKDKGRDSFLPIDVLYIFVALTSIFIINQKRKYQ